MANRLEQDMVGKIVYTLTVDGVVLEELTHEEAIEYLHGANNIVAGLESALEGKQAGARFQVDVKPADAHGEYDKSLIEEVPLEDIDDAEELEAGMLIDIFDDEGEMYEAIILDVTDKVVKIDFNHELAGKTLHYDVEILEVREATEGEIAAGVPDSLMEEINSFFSDDEDDDYELEEE